MSLRKMWRDEVNLGACPECGSISLMGDAFDTEGTDVRQQVSCLDCEASWFDTFTLSTRTVDCCVSPYVLEFY